MKKSKFMYLKMAINNLKNNNRAYLPYVLASIIIITNFYIIYSISQNKGIDEMIGAAALKTMLILGVVIIGIFATIFLIYTNSFLIKQRKKEIGLYCILGMEKKHIGIVLFYETMITSLGSIIIGLILGIIFSKFMFLILLNILRTDVHLAFYISIKGMITTSILFGLIFLFTLITNLYHITVSNPINLLHGGEKGEKEPKAKIFITIFGFVTLFLGYAIALYVESPISAIYMFFVAATLVIFGVYALFTQGSIFILKILKKNKKFYYSIKNFISVSGMIYRMKANAVGLANICILSTMVLVVLSITVSLYTGAENIIANLYPNDCTISKYDAAKEKEDDINLLIDDAQKKYDILILNKISYRYIGFKAHLNGNKLNVPNIEDNNSYAYEKLCNFYVTTILEYNKMKNTNLEISKDEVLFFINKNSFGFNEVKIENLNFKVKGELEDFYIYEKTLNPPIVTCCIVVYDVGNMDDIFKEFDKEHTIQTDYGVSFDIKADKEKIRNFNTYLNDELTKIDVHFSSKLFQREQLNSIDGGFLFIGLFLGVLFIIATVLIIYYKQISEGYDDNTRFKIMQKVGMSKFEVKRTIQNQILMVFFIPLIGAIVNLGFAFKMITKLLGALGLTNIPLFFACSIIIVILFTIFYIFVYKETAKTYYKIVN